MVLRTLGLVAVAAMTLAACTDTPTTPDNPAAASMTFKTGARYEYESYMTDPTTQVRRDTSARRRTWTLVNAGASVHGQTGVAVYIDSLFSTGGGFINVTDSVLLQQRSNNDVYRYASMLAELDFATEVPLLGSLDIGRDWQHEVRLNSTVGIWLSDEIADTLPSPVSLPGVTGIKVSVTDSSIGSTTENVTIGGQSYATTKATHSIRLSVHALIGAGQFAVPIEVGSASIGRTIWIAPSLGAIVKEIREGKVLDVAYQGQGFSVPIPGYVSTMTRVIATGG